MGSRSCSCPMKRSAEVTMLSSRIVDNGGVRSRIGAGVVKDAGGISIGRMGRV